MQLTRVETLYVPVHVDRMAYQEENTNIVPPLSRKICVKEYC
jgi:hypothetical protein